jgi:hypothetical protein
LPNEKELIWFPFSPLKVGSLLAVIRAAAARGKRRFGIINRGMK